MIKYRTITFSHIEKESLMNKSGDKLSNNGQLNKVIKSNMYMQDLGNMHIFQPTC